MEENVWERRKEESSENPRWSKYMQICVGCLSFHPMVVQYNSTVYSSTILVKYLPWLCHCTHQVHASPGLQLATRSVRAHASILNTVLPLLHVWPRCGALFHIPLAMGGINIKRHHQIAPIASLINSFTASSAVTCYTLLPNGMWNHSEHSANFIVTRKGMQGFFKDVVTTILSRRPWRGYLSYSHIVYSTAILFSPLHIL